MKTIIRIQNLKCGGCANTIAKRLKSLNGVQDVSIEEDTSQVSIFHDSGCSIEEIENMLSRLGYPIEGSQNDSLKRAKSYVSCAAGRLTK
ncbi:heavy-metal-associated domain-containing protein [Flagellimonas allohymeniacidonis]|uniref:Heavy-metal-associated domain-containing protein n=1 Tax=Flagellimonas allohymeniacidonis TaxID=2517819 RepID=A0A4Q8QF29_9FLAO|nr:heavy metal-associated domain-containing protein [Allomuricauda hymeniacidonis]TAI48444.1 heavy-metal-associated domain-containing protein [Allomuricauda hymeniacidonis]